MDTTNLNLSDSNQTLSITPRNTAPAGITQHYLAECESLRGIAILLVILFHAYLKGAKEYPLQPNFFSAFIISGNTGVVLFFVLSGFLLNLPFLRNQKPSLSTFYKNRALRILPMYIVMVVIGGAYRKDFFTALQALFFWNIDLDTLWPFGAVWWSLAVEVQFYLLLPSLYWLGRSARLCWLIYPIFFAGCFTYLLFTGHLPWKPGHFYIFTHSKNSILCLWPVFFLGGVLAWAHNNYKSAISNYTAASRFLSRGGSDLVFFTVLLLLGATLLQTSWLGPWATHADHFDYVIIEAALWALLIAALLFLPLKTKFIWSNPIFSFFGIISYSLYLLHDPTMILGLRFINNHQLGSALISKPVLIAILIILATGLSMLTYALIEKPALNLKRKVTG